MPDCETLTDNFIDDFPTDDEYINEIKTMKDGDISEEVLVL